MKLFNILYLIVFLAISKNIECLLKNSSNINKKINNDIKNISDNLKAKIKRTISVNKITGKDQENIFNLTKEYNCYKDSSKSYNGNFTNCVDYLLTKTSPPLEIYRIIDSIIVKDQNITLTDLNILQEKFESKKSISIKLNTKYSYLSMFVDTFIFNFNKLLETTKYLCNTDSNDLKYSILYNYTKKEILDTIIKDESAKNKDIKQNDFSLLERENQYIEEMCFQTVNLLISQIQIINIRIDNYSYKNNKSKITILFKVENVNHDSSEELLMMSNTKLKLNLVFSFVYKCCCVLVLFLILILEIYFEKLVKLFKALIKPNLRKLSKSNVVLITESLMNNVLIKNEMLDNNTQALKNFCNKNKFISYSNYRQIIKETVSDNSNLVAVYDQAFNIKYSLISIIVLNIISLLLYLAAFLLFYPFCVYFSEIITNIIIFFASYVIMMKVLNILNDFGNYSNLTTELMTNNEKVVLRDGIGYSECILDRYNL
jgi:hypothetical protein